MDPLVDHLPVDRRVDQEASPVDLVVRHLRGRFLEDRSFSNRSKETRAGGLPHLPGRLARASLFVSGSGNLQAGGD